MKEPRDFTYSRPALLEVEGLRGTAKELYREAVRRGFDGALTTFETRLHHAPLTWERLLLPVDRSPQVQALLAGNKAHRAQDAAQVAAAVSAVDARRRELAEREVPDVQED